MTNTEVAEAEKGSRKYLVGGMALALVAAIGVGASLAYLVDRDSVSNQFSLDTNLSIGLIEPSFVADDAKGIVPAQVIAKDPTVVNQGSVEAYIAATVKVPVFSGGYLDGTGSLKAASDADLFTYSLCEGWQEIGVPSIKDGYSTHTYVYSSKLPADSSTEPIFNDVTLANLTEDPGITDTEVDVTAYAIQAHGFADAQEAYTAYLAQNAAAAIAD